MDDEWQHQRLEVACDADVSTVVVFAYGLVSKVGGKIGVATEFATMVSELATNIIKYAARGSVHFRYGLRSRQTWMEVLAEDQGPGIADISLALEDNFSTRGTLGVGLPGVKRMADEFEIRSTLGEGTTVRVAKRIS